MRPQHKKSNAAKNALPIKNLNSIRFGLLDRLRVALIRRLCGHTKAVKGWTQNLKIRFEFRKLNPLGGRNGRCSGCEIRESKFRFWSLDIKKKQ